MGEFLLLRCEFEERLVTFGVPQSTVRQGSDHGLNIPEVGAIGEGPW